MELADYSAVIYVFRHTGRLVEKMSNENKGLSDRNPRIDARERPLEGLTLQETIVARAVLRGESGAGALAIARGRARVGREENRDFEKILASERVRRAIAHITSAIRPADMRAFILERLVAEAEDATEGSVRLRAVEKLGDLPGIDAWRQAPNETGIVASGAELNEALQALEARLMGDVSDVVDTVQSEPDDSQAIDNAADPWDRG